MPGGHSQATKSERRTKRHSQPQMQEQSQSLAQVSAPDSATPQTQLPPQAPSPLPTPLGGGRVDDKELLTKEKLMQRDAFQGHALDIAEIRALVDLVGNYQGIIANNKIPGDGPDFIKAMGAVNANIMKAHDNLIDTLAKTSLTLQQNIAKRIRLFTKEATFARLHKLSDDCANLATIAQSQKIYLNKIYDDMIDAKQTNSGALSQASGKTYGEILSNVELYRFSSGSARALGAGGINTVYRDRFQGRDRVFKRGKHYEHSQLNEHGFEANVGFEVMKYRMKYRDRELFYGNRSAGRVIEADTAQRDVAYSRLNKLFGFDIAVSTQLAGSEAGETSSLMDMAQGEGADQFLFYVGEEWSETAKEWAQQTYDEKLAMALGAIDKARKHINDQDALRANGTLSEKEYRESIRTDENIILEAESWMKKHQRRGTLQTVNLTDPKVAIQLFKMSVLDMVAGHVDRHMGNYMINQTENGEVKLTAIDNDTAFGERTDIQRSKDIKGGEERPALEESFPFVPKEILDTTMAVTGEDLAQALTGLLSKPQIEAACERLRQVQEWFRQLAEKNRVKEVSADSMQELFNKDRFGSYFATLYQGARPGQSPTLQTSPWFKKHKPRPLPKPDKAPSQTTTQTTPQLTPQTTT